MAKVILNPKAIRLPSTEDRSSYIWVPQANGLIAREQSENGVNWEEGHKQLALRNVSMAPLLAFRYHLKNTFDKKSVLYDGAGERLSQTEVKDVRKQMSEDENTWFYLDARFENKDVMTQYSDHCVKAGKIIAEKKSSVQTIKNDGFVDLIDFNDEGLPMRRSKKQKYCQRENLYFWTPRDGKVAWFGVYTDWAFLYCIEDPLVSNSALGVLAYAVGAQKTAETTGVNAQTLEDILAIGNRTILHPGDKENFETEMRKRYQ